MGKMKELSIDIENNTRDLFNFLDGYCFSSCEEVEIAAGEYIENTTGSLYWSDLAIAGELAERYIKERSLVFNE